MTKLRVAGIAAGVFVLLAIIGSFLPTPEKRAPIVEEQPAELIQADQLWTEYSHNEIAADQRFKNKTVDVVGRIVSISKSAFGSPFVALQVQGQAIGTIQCTFPTSAADRLAALSPNQVVTIRGRVTGFAIGTVSLDKCSLR